MSLSLRGTVESLLNKGPRDWQNLFAITRFHCSEVLFHAFYYCWGEGYSSFYRGLYIEGSLNRGEGAASVTFGQGCAAKCLKPWPY